MKRILIINPFGLGDVLFTTPVITALKKKFPDSFIAYICNSRFESILKNNPNIDKLLFYSRGDFKRIKKRSYVQYIKALFAAIYRLWSMKFDIAVDLSMVNQYSCILWLIGVRQRYGFDYRGRGFFLNHKILFYGFEDKHVVEHYRRLLTQLGIKFSGEKLSVYTAKEDEVWAEKFLKQNFVKDTDVLVGVAPFGGSSWGAQASSKQWPLKRFAYVVNKIIEKHKVKVILFGTGGDLTQGAEFKKYVLADNLIDALGKTQLGQLVALIKKCTLFIGNDSGPLHIAVACDLKTVSIFGPVDEKIYGPIGNKNQHCVISKNLNCRPCYKNFKKPTCQSMECLLTIEADDVLNKVEQML